MTNLLTKSRLHVKTKTQGKYHVRMEGWKEAYTSQGIPEMASSPPDGEEEFPYSFQREHGPANTLNMNFKSPEPEDSKFL